MDTNTIQQVNFHFDILPRKTKKALDFLAKQKWLKDSAWYLAGGTALTLQAGHRRSLDLDFFFEEKDFANEDILGKFYKIREWKVNMDRKNTIYGELFKAKVSFIAYPFFVPKQEFFSYGFVRILNKKDIAVMKIIAISQRGKKRDFYDLYWCVHNIEPLEDIIRRLKKQYPLVAHDYHHILKALVYFKDAESDPAPSIYFEASWRKVKQFFIKEIPRIAEKLIR